jgi:hypothetical protein
MLVIKVVFKYQFVKLHHAFNFIWLLPYFITFRSTIFVKTHPSLEIYKRETRPKSA